MTKADTWQVLECCRHTVQHGLSPADLDWIMAERERAEAFEAILRAFLSARAASP